MWKTVVYSGINVSSKKLDACIETRPGEETEGVFDNTSAGHKKLIARLTHRGQSARVVVEPTGVYSLELCLALHRARRIEVMVVNPRASSSFSHALMNRSKSDKIDAQMLLEYVKRMPFEAWTPPSGEVLELQSITRHVQALIKTRTQERNRLKAIQRTPDSETIQAELRRHIAFINESVHRLRDEALEIVNGVPKLKELLGHLVSIKGIAVASGLTLLAELASLPPGMTARQWVAHAGLDPRLIESGTSIHRPARISKTGNAHLRAVLYMPALVAIRREPAVAAYYDKLLQRGKPKMVATVAVMRKLLHALNGMLRTGSDFDGARFHAISA